MIKIKQVWTSAFATKHIKNELWAYQVSKKIYKKLQSALLDGFLLFSKSDAFVPKTHPLLVHDQQQQILVFLHFLEHLQQPSFVNVITTLLS
jgi:hypothetical protein